MYTLVLLRHGQSVWNEKNLFTGWVDVDLTAKGEEEARRGGRLLAASGVLPDVAHTSLQKRAIRTCNLALEEADRLWIPVSRHWRLNERHYGALTGLDKKAVAEEHGPEQLKLWRRSYDTPPPAMAPDHEHWAGDDPRYQLLPPDVVPATECLADVVARFLPYWEDRIVADLRAQKTVLVAAHGNSLRALVKHLDGLTPDEIAELNIPTGIPLVYRLDELLQPIVPDDHQPGEPKASYLDPEAARSGAAAVAAQSATGH